MARADRWGRRRKMTGPLISTRAADAVSRMVSLSEATAHNLARFVARVSTETGVAVEEIEVRTLDLALAALFHRDRLFRSRSQQRDPRQP